MVETTTLKGKAKPAGAAGPTVESVIEAPLPQFEAPKLEVPAAFREFAERGVSQVRESYEKMKSAAEEATDLMEASYASASKGATDYGRKLIEAARSNTNAAFDYATALMGAKSLAEVIELSTTHARKQFESLSAQSKDLTALAQQVATETSEPLKTGFNKAFRQVA